MESLFDHKDPFKRAVSPTTEMAAYEALWVKDGMTFKKIADAFKQNPDMLPSELVSPSEIHEALEKIKSEVDGSIRHNFGVRVNGTFEYPKKLRDAKNPLEVFYYQGDWDLIFSPSIAIVGARKVSEEGARRTRKLVKSLVGDGYTIVSGLAEGVDTIAHETAIAFGGKTIAVIGTPLDQVYPKKNSELQREIAKNHLLISQVPFLKYKKQDYRINRGFFPERNITMSAISMATVIIEASDTSGTLYQARAAIAQDRKLFILDSCFKNQRISWPQRFEKKGAIRVVSYQDIKDSLPE